MGNQSKRRKRAKERARQAAAAGASELPAEASSASLVEPTSVRELASTSVDEDADTPPAGTPVPREAAPRFVGGRFEPPPATPPTVDTASQYITGPVAPKPRALAPAVQAAPTRLIDEPVVQRELERVNVENGSDEDEEDELLEEDEDGEEDDADEDDAIVEFAAECLDAQSKKETRSWKELTALLCIAEVDDPRLAILCALLQEEERPAPVDRALALLQALDLGELVEEAREALAQGELDDDDRAAARESARLLGGQSKRELNESYGKAGTKLAPRKASEIRERQSRSHEAVGRAVSPPTNASRPR